MNLKHIADRQRFAGIWLQGPERNLEDYQIIEFLLKEIERLKKVGK